MLKIVKGIYHEGKIEFLEILPNIPSRTQVIITFLDPEDFTLDMNPPYYDLDHLFGHWSEIDEEEFLGNTLQFSTIDSELW